MNTAFLKQCFLVLCFLYIGVLVFPVFAQAETPTIQSLRAKIDALLAQALVLRQEIKQQAFAQPIQATPRVPGQKQVALQVGHWKLENAPWELRNLNPHRQAQGGGYMEWEINLRVAQETQTLLEQEGIGVTLLPAILPGTYKADAFVAIHADQNPSAPWLSGFKVASSAFDTSKNAHRLAQAITNEYRLATWLTRETYIPDSMTHYYAFNTEKFLYAVHPKTPAIIIETGYLPNPRDRAVILSNPQWAAQGIAKGILQFLNNQPD
jgi:hypothetical protein